MRENCTYGSEGGEGQPFPTPINVLTSILRHNPPMLFLLSPAKTLDYDTPAPPELPHTTPLFVKQAAELIAVLRQQSPQQIAQLMKLSDPLASLNAARYAT